MTSDLAPREIMSVLLEGCRRHDELQRINAFITDDLIFAKGGVKPTPHEEEDDPNIVREVWMKTSAGTPVVDCEKELPTDSYRVRRLVAHWLETGALIAK